MSKRFYLLGLVLIVVLPAFLLNFGCMSEVTYSPTFKVTSSDGQTPTIFYQFIDPERHFNTSDIDLAQQEIPFTIIVPSYIPECFGIDYLFEITGPYIDEYSDTI